VRELRALGISPDILVCRSTLPITKVHGLFISSSASSFSFSSSSSSSSSVTATAADVLYHTIQETKQKLSNFCHVPQEAVIGCHDVSNTYAVPLLLSSQNLHTLLVPI
jgi:CTP synthase (UTP-ammonia lyase)